MHCKLAPHVRLAERQCSLQQTRSSSRWCGDFWMQAVARDIPLMEIHAAAHRISFWHAVRAGMSHS